MMHTPSILLDGLRIPSLLSSFLVLSMMSITAAMGDEMGHTFFSSFARCAFPKIAIGRCRVSPVSCRLTISVDRVTALLGHCAWVRSARGSPKLKGIPKTTRNLTLLNLIWPRLFLSSPAFMRS